MQSGEKNKGTQIGKEGVKLSLFRGHDHICRKSDESYKKTFKLVSEFRKATR